jgi:hypothetical protein
MSRGESAMGQIASEALIERLADWRTGTVFGRRGDGINGRNPAGPSLPAGLH